MLEPAAYSSLGELLADALVQWKTETALLELDRARENARLPPQVQGWHQRRTREPSGSTHHTMSFRASKHSPPAAPPDPPPPPRPMSRRGSSCASPSDTS